MSMIHGLTRDEGAVHAGDLPVLDSCIIYHLEHACQTPAAVFTAGCRAEARRRVPTSPAAGGRRAGDATKLQTRDRVAHENSRDGDLAARIRPHSADDRRSLARIDRADEPGAGRHDEVLQAAGRHIHTDGALRGGLFVSGRIIVSTRARVVQVPREALLNWNVAENTATVFVVRDSQAGERTVKTGAANGTSVEIVSGLTAGDVVVTRGGFALKNGDRVILAAYGSPDPYRRHSSCARVIGSWWEVPITTPTSSASAALAVSSS